MYLADLTATYILLLDTFFANIYPIHNFLTYSYTNSKYKQSIHLQISKWVKVFHPIFT